MIVSLVVLLLIVIGALYFFAGRAGEKPMTRIEKAVELGNLAG